MSGDQAPQATRPPRPIGIIGGSGPEAGVDLAAKVVAATRRLRGSELEGDADFPPFELVSDPRLGASMDLEAHADELWEILADVAGGLARRVDVFAVACNTLNWFGPRLAALELGAHLVHFGDVARRFAAERERVALLGARQVAGLGEWSAYAGLDEAVTVEQPADPDRLHELIHAIKTYGPDDAATARELADLIDGLTSETVLLACTELPLVELDVPDKELVDISRLVADELVRSSYHPRPPT